MVVTDSFTALYAVPMDCKDCSDSIRTSLSPLQGIESMDFDMQQQLVAVRGSVPPSSIIKAIQTTGRDAIVRGTGEPNSAAVCILESHHASEQKSPVKGLARVVSVSPTQSLFDITLNGLPKGKYYPSVTTGGDISEGAKSVGAQYLDLGEVEVDQPTETPGLYSGQTFVKRTASISEIIGRAFTVSNEPASVNDHSLVGVIARSAGVWENLKQVCTCSGKTVWQERQDAVEKGL